MSSDASSVLTVLHVTPEIVTVPPGASVQFEVRGLDQLGRRMDAGPASWSTTGGTIYTSGLFVAGDTPGVFQVIATVSGLRATALVTVGTATDVEGGDVPEIFEIESVYPNPVPSRGARVSVAVPTAGSLSLHLVDMLGRRTTLLPTSQVSAARHTFAIDPAALGMAPGVYVLEVWLDRRRDARTLVVGGDRASFGTSSMRAARSFGIGCKYPYG